uniref:Uncharacterized protein n=1 Tax=Lutzomyia longipalpis TaxID=7200 RepID=A0A1B0GJC5_LUTLO
MRPRSVSPTPMEDEEKPPEEVVVVPNITPKWAYGTMTNDQLMEVKKQIGIIDVSFPEAKDPKFEEFTDFPPSYTTLSAKEKVILMFAENFRQQYNEKYIDRMPLILALKNECGVQKFVSTTIRPTSLHYPDLIGSWEKISSFVADHIEYEPLAEPTKMLMEVKKQIGIIDVSFPEAKDPKFEEFTDFPPSYTTLSAKEKVILMFAENFRQQYNEKYIDRMPLILALKNECGVQKFVSTTIRPTSLHYPDLIGSWEKISSFVADHIEYEPLAEPTKM